MGKSDYTNVCLCRAVKDGAKPKQLRPLVRDARYICGKCGRAAASKGSLCAPRPLGKG